MFYWKIQKLNFLKKWVDWLLDSFWFEFVFYEVIFDSLEPVQRPSETGRERVLAGLLYGLQCGRKRGRCLLVFPLSIALAWVIGGIVGLRDEIRFLPLLNLNPILALRILSAFFKIVDREFKGISYFLATSIFLTRFTSTSSRIFILVTKSRILRCVFHFPWPGN